MVKDWIDNIDMREESPNSSSRRGSTPKVVVIHYTAGGNGLTTAQWMCSVQARRSAHFVIDRDGWCCQIVPIWRAAWHAGEARWREHTNVNQISIGIELANWGRLERDKDGSTWCWLGEFRLPYHGPEAVEVGGQWWEPYPDDQIDRLRQLLAQLKSEGLPIEEVVGHSDIAPSRKIDPGLAFPWDAALR